MSAHVRSINVGQPQDAEWAGRLGRTAIVKTAALGPVQIKRRGLDGDQVADTSDHGGGHKAVYVFAREDLDLWSARLGRHVPDGLFGENLTTAGLEVNDALIGERWRIGTSLLEVAEARIPCVVFTNHLARAGFDSRGWVKRFTAEARTGPYLRVLEEGTVTPGDRVEVVHRPAHDITVSMVFKAMTTHRDLLPRLLDAGEALSPLLRRAADSYVPA